MTGIQRLNAIEILDSRGRPTVYCRCQLASGAAGAASVPSGASTGSGEALELRDGDPGRYQGLGCRQAVSNINRELQAALAGSRFDDQAQLDGALLALDATPNKARLGANAILAVSLAFARAAARERNLPLYQYFAQIIANSQPHLPRPMINLFSGGKHAGGQVEVQDVQVLPVTAASMDDLLSVTFDVYYAAARLAAEQYGVRLLTADEGGLAPPFPDVEAMFDMAVRAVERAGLKPGGDVALTVDVAASHFYADGRYRLGQRALCGDEMVEQLMRWAGEYPIVSVEDGLAEDDWPHWQAFYQKAATHLLILGDDLLCTNPQRIQTAIARSAANALLLKVNQIGTVTEAAQAYQLAKTHGWRIVVSARSGETEDDWLADLAVGWSADHIKVGSITQSERLAKYNRLLVIESETGFSMPPFSILKH
jgi:enolase